MLSAGTSNLTRRCSNGHMINRPIFYDCWYADTVLWGGFTGWRPHSTRSIPLLTRIFDDTTPMKCRFKARLQICNNLDSWLALYVWPHTELLKMLSEMATASDNIVTPDLDKKLSWVKSGSLTKKLNTQQGSTHYFLSDCKRNQVCCETLPKLHWPTESDCCYMEHMKQKMNEPTITVRLHRTCLETMYIFHRLHCTGKPACGDHEVRTFPRSGQLLVEIRSSCFCSCTNDWHSDQRASISTPPSNLSRGVYQVTSWTAA